MDKRLYKIHPAIGIARVGNAGADTFFIGPEIPGAPVTGVHRLGTRVPPFKADKDKETVKPQAARFRIWEYVKNAGGKWEASREVSLATKEVRSIEWKVHLANCKASFHEFSGPAGDGKPADVKRNLWKKKPRGAYLDIDFGPRTISGKSKPGVEFRVDPKLHKSQTYPIYAPGHPSDGSPIIDYLGELRTDPSGRLIVIGGKGEADCLLAATDPDFGFLAELNQPFDNDLWFDDVSDGPVAAKLTIEIDGRVETPAVAGAWVLVAPPDFAPDAPTMVTLYDVLYDMAVWDLDLPKDQTIYDGELASLRDLNQELRVKKHKGLADYVVSYATEIAPVFARVRRLGRLNKTIRDNHAALGGPGNEAMDALLAEPAATAENVRKHVFGRLRPHPDLPKKFPIDKAGERDMPRMFGDDYPRDALALTRTTYALFQRWSVGGFVQGTDPGPGSITPHGLDRAALEHALGGALHPGIETSWQIRSPKLYSEPFRIDHKAKSTYWGESWKTIGPGHFTRQLAIPWHSDFYECGGAHTKGYKTYLAWWPGQRPDEVRRKGGGEDEAVAWFRASGKGRWDIKRELDDDPDDDFTPYPKQYRAKMVENWSRLGFVVSEGGDFLETERGTEEFS
jgi:hypothetical protein